MGSIVIYFVKANIILSLLYGFYFLLLRNEKFFTLNRYLLLSIIALSILLPLLPPGPGLFTPLHNHVQILSPLNRVISQLAAYPAAKGAGNLRVSQPVAGTTAPPLSLLGALVSLYLLVAAILLFQFIRQLFAIRRLLRSNERQAASGIICVHHQKDLPPFSFFNTMVINKSQYPAEEYEQVIAHEQVHIRQVHTLDLLLAEMVRILFWINPLAYRLRRAIKLNLEYLVDERVLRTGIDKKKYQVNLLNSSVNTGPYRLVNLFTSSKIKLRIKMMNKKRSPRRNLYKYAVVLPVLLAAYFATGSVSAQSAKVPAVNHLAGNATPLRFKKVYVVINAHTKKEELENIRNRLKDWDIDLTIRNASFKDGLLSEMNMEVNVPGIFKGSATCSANQLLTDPAIFYYEPGAGFHVSIGLPSGNISSDGKKVITDNLKGVLIEYPGGKELHGSCRWD
ncbi:MAG TPA: M56 family metallopeptidase [Puia sp.]|nr:M56 family metallopeptidase [Puia sp.]